MTGKLLKLIVYLFIEYISYLLIYVIIFGAKITKSKNKLIFTIVSILTIHISTLLIIDIRTAYAISMITMILIPLFAFEKRQKSHLYIYPFVTLSTSIVGISISYFCALFLKMSVSDITQGNWYTIFCQVIPMAVLFVLYIKIKLEKKEFYQINLRLKQYIVFYLVAISLFLMMAPMQSLQEDNYNGSNINVIGAATSLGCITLAWVAIWQGISAKKEAESKKKNLILEEYLTAQRKYYENLLKQEEKMRRFRHDMNAHVIALKAYVEKGKIENIQEYLNRIILESAIYDVRKYTGNKIIDAVITQLLEDAEKKKISIEVKGHLEEESATKSYDLCTILSNLLKNAIEACDEIDNDIERNIILAIAMYDRTTYIYIKNNVKEKVIIKDKYPKSTKEPSTYHGLGYGNLKHIIDKYEGLIEFHTTDKYFEVEIII